MTTRIEPLTRALLEPAFDLATEVFIAGSTLHRALGIGLAEYRTYLRPSFEAMVDEGLSVVALRDGTVEGCLILTDFYPHVYGDGAAPGAFAPLAALGAELATAYRARGPIEPGDVVLADMGAVSPSAAGRGTYQALRAEAQRLARDRGFTRIVGELSSRATQHVVLKKLGHEAMAEVPFATFEFEGRHPFAAITDPESLVLAEGWL